MLTKGAPPPPTIASRLDTPAAPAAIVALLHLLIIALRLASLGFDPSRFVVAGDRVVDRAAAPPTLFVLSDSYGYDGTFYYRFALDPWNPRRDAHGIRLGDPAYYQQRMLYPLLARLLSGGDPQRLASALILVNYLGLCALGWLGGSFARRVGRHALWGTAVALAPPLVFSLARDLTEIVEATMLVAALLALRAERHGGAALLLSLAALARPSALLLAGGVALAQRPGGPRRRPRPAWVWAVPMVVAGAWRLWLEWHWGASANRVMRRAFAPPGVDLAAAWWSAATRGDGYGRILFLQHCALALFVAAVAWSSRGGLAARHERDAWYLAVVMVAMLGTAVWVSDWGFVRVLVECYVLGVILLLSARTRVADVSLAGGLLWWVATAIEVLWWHPV